MLFNIWVSKLCASDISVPIIFSDIHNSKITEEFFYHYTTIEAPRRISLPSQPRKILLMEMVFT
jgi:hypothetical protein